MDQTFESYRPLLFSIAYRMLGSVMEAEDMVQETYLRYQAAAQDNIQSTKAFLTTITTRLCINHLNSAKVQREAYIGPWLPEPLFTDDKNTPARQMDTYESISMAFLILLESLTPPERAVFLLREVFDYSYPEIAETIGKEEAACRQLLSRAKKHLSTHRPRFEPQPDQHRQMLQNFMSMVENGQTESLMNLLADDVAFWSDGGGKINAAIYPLYGKDVVGQFIMGTYRFLPEGYSTEIKEVNGEPALVVLDEGRILMIISVEYDGQHVRAVRLVVNPDKLRQL